MSEKISRPIYVPIADSFFESSIMFEPLTVRFVMLALIRLALRPGCKGVVDVDPRVFAASINIPYPEVEAAILALMEPDEHSGSPLEEGRRIVPLNTDRPLRGWRLVNIGKYEHLVHLANDAARKRRDRAAQDKPDVADASENVHERPETSRDGATNTKTKTKTKTNTGGVGGVGTDETGNGGNALVEQLVLTPDEKAHLAEVSETRYPADFAEWWMAYGPSERRLGKGPAAKAWAKLSKADRARALGVLPAFKRMNAGKKPEFIPTAATFLSQRRFDDLDQKPSGPDPATEAYRRQMAELKTTPPQPEEEP